MQAEYKDALNRQVARQAQDAASSAADAAADQAFLQSERRRVPGHPPTSAAASHPPTYSCHAPLGPHPAPALRH
jgi:hypothetical protein